MLCTFKMKASLTKKDGELKLTCGGVLECNKCQYISRPFQDSYLKKRETTEFKRKCIINMRTLCQGGCHDAGILSELKPILCPCTLRYRNHGEYVEMTHYGEHNHPKPPVRRENSLEKKTRIESAVKPTIAFEKPYSNAGTNRMREVRTKTDDTEKISKIYGDSIRKWTIKPTLLIVICTPFQSHQLARTPNAPVSFDTTFNFTSSKLKLSTFVVQSNVLSKKFFPIMFAIHELVDADTYCEIFLNFFKIFGFFGNDGFAGVTTDFADAIIIGFLTAADKLMISRSISEELIRGCTFHFQKNVEELLKQNSIPSDQAKKIRSLSYQLILYSKKKNEEKNFKIVEQKFERILNGIVPAGAEFIHWWKKILAGFHWKMIFQLSGPRSHLLSTTNGSESQHRVFKHKEHLKHLPKFGIDPLMQMIKGKEELYQLALSGSTQGAPRNHRKSRKEKKSTAEQGPPKLYSKLKSRMDDPLPIWKWTANSCAYDALLAIVSFSSLQFSRSFFWNRHETSQAATRSHANYLFREEWSALVEQIHTVWQVSELGFAEKTDELTQIRDKFRKLLYPLIGLNQSRGMGGFAGFDDLFSVFSQKMIISNRMQSGISSRSPAPSLLVILAELNTSFEDYLANLDSRNQSITDETILFMVEFPRDSSDAICKAWDQQLIPLEFRHNPTNTHFELIGVVDYDRSHYRYSLLLRQPLITPLGTSLKPGVYRVDPISMNRFEWVGLLPTTSRQLKNRIPPFTSPTFKPHGIIYIKTIKI